MEIRVYSNNLLGYWWHEVNAVTVNGGWIWRGTNLRKLKQQAKQWLEDHR